MNRKNKKLKQLTLSDKKLVTKEIEEACRWKVLSSVIDECYKKMMMTKIEEPYKLKQLTLSESEEYNKKMIKEEINEAYRSSLIGIHEYWLLTGNYEIVK